MIPLRAQQPSLSRDFAVLSTFILFILAIVSVWVTVETLSNFNRDVQKQMESEALRLDRGLIVEIENASYILESVGRQIQATGDTPENIAQLFFSFAKTEGPKRSIFSWINREQMLTVSNNLGVMKEPIDVSDRDYVKKSIAEPWKIHIGRPIDGRLSHKWVLPLSLGLTDNNGTYMGSVIVSLDTDALGDAVSRTIKDTGIRFAITNTALTLLTQSPSSASFFQENFDITQLGQINFDQVRSGEYSQASLLKSKQMYTYFERSSEYPYIIFLGLDSAHSKTSIYKLLMPRLFQLFVIAMFLLFVLWTVRRRIIQPVIELTGLAAAIVRGERFAVDYSHGPMEIQSLAYEIKRLYDYIEERRRVEGELRLKNAELTRIKEAAQLTNQVKADFFTHVGEELTEPVEQILEQSETLKDQHFGPLGNGKYLASALDIYEQAKSLLMMLVDIKAISRAETGILALNDGPVDMAFVLQKTIRIFREKQPAPVDIQLDMDEEMPQIRADELRIKQMILNILSAISKQLGQNDGIRISSYVRAHEFSLAFSYQSSIRRAGGHGLELALARLLIAMHQGALEMKTANDQTTTIALRFPAGRMLPH